MTALSDALDHSQAKALAALFKAYTRRDDEPDDDVFRAMMIGVGLDDEVQIGFLLAAWRIMRDDREALPASNGSSAKAEPEQQASDAQLSLIRKLCSEKGYPAPDYPFTKTQATAAIDGLKAGTYKPQDWDVPF